MKYYNCHAHTFNMQYVPEHFLSFTINQRAANIVHWILKKKALAKGLMFVLKPFLKPTGKKTIAFLSIGLKKTQDMIFEELFSRYPQSDDSRFIILPLDFTFMGAGDVAIPYEQQLKDLFEVKKKYPTRCFPFVAIDPRKGNSIQNRDFVKNYIEKGFSGIKLYPAMGFFPYDERLFHVYEYAEQNDIPILTHCSRGGINYCSTQDMNSIQNPVSFNPVPNKNYNYPYDGKQKLGQYCDPLNSPEQLEEVLSKFRNLKICVAHLGMDSTSGTANLEWYNKIKDLMIKYPNVYTDISYSLSLGNFYDWFLKEYANLPAPASSFSPPLSNRFMFGTDFFMTVQELQGEDNELFDKAIKNLGIPLFEKLAYDNVTEFLQSDLADYTNI